MPRNELDYDFNPIARAPSSGRKCALKSQRWQLTYVDSVSPSNVEKVLSSLQMTGGETTIHRMLAREGLWRSCIRRVVLSVRTCT